MPSYATTDPMLRLATRLRVDPATNCWLFTGPARNGYAAVWDNARGMVYGHRLVYERIRTSVPLTLDLHHVCGNRLCCNPWHVEPLAHREHARLHSTQTHCRNGHEYNAVNTWVSKAGKNYCRVCQRERKRQQRAARREVPQGQ